MKLIDYIEDEIPDYAFSYFVNGDASGIEDEDRAVAAARRHLREFAEQAEPLHETARRLDVPTRKAALVRWLNLHAEHPDNG